MTRFLDVAIQVGGFDFFPALDWVSAVIVKLFDLRPAKLDFTSLDPDGAGQCRQLLDNVLDRVGQSWKAGKHKLRAAFKSALQHFIHVDTRRCTVIKIFHSFYMMSHPGNFKKITLRGERRSERSS